MFHTPKAPAWGRLHRAVLATAGATCLLLASAVPAAAVDWPQPLPENEFGASTRLDIFEGGPVRVTIDGTRIAPNPNPTEPSTGTGVFQPFYTVHRSTGSCNSGARCISYESDGQTVEDVLIEGGFNSDTATNSINYEMTRSNGSGGPWTRSVTMSEFNISPGSSGYIELQFDVNETGSGTSDENKIVITDLQIFIGPNLDTPEQSNSGPDGTGYTGGTFDTDASSSPNQLLGLDPVWTLDNTTNGNVDILLQASICANSGQCGSGHGDMSIFIPISQLGSFDPDDNFVLYTENLFVDDGFTEVRFRTARVVPEPGMLALFGVGVIGLGYIRRRRGSCTACKGERLPV